MFGLNLTAWLAIGCAVLGVIVVAEGIAVKGAWDSERAAKDTLRVRTAERDGLSRDLDNAIEARDREHREADAADAKAKAQLAEQKKQAADIRIALDAATDQTETLIQQIQDAHNAQPLIVSQTVTDGWYPLIAAGFERLKCVQRAANRGDSADGCGISLPISGGSTGAAGEAARAGDYRPGFDAQLRALNDMWRLREWGASCYRDKAAIAESQK